MKRIIAYLVISTACIWSIQGQERSSMYDQHISEICGFVNTLHQNPSSYEQVFKDLSQKEYWRLMEEFNENCTPKSSLCSLWDKVEMTGINDRAFQAEQKRGSIPQSTDNFCSGNETNYSYSFFECRILAGKSISSQVSYRQGPQLFIVMPYNPGSISASLYVDGKPVSGHTDKDGNIVFEITEAVSTDAVIDITLTNTSATNQSAVIINNNTRK